MSPIVFGSPEAVAIVKQDREKFGAPDSEPAFPTDHRWHITTVGKKEVQGTYAVVAASEKQARGIWEHGGGELLSEETTADADDFDCEITEITDEGEVTA